MESIMGAVRSADTLTGICFHSISVVQQQQTAAVTRGVWPVTGWL